MWHRIAPLCPGKVGDPGGTGTDSRLFPEAILWRVRTGCPRRDLPARFGKWNSVFRRFRRRVRKGVSDTVLRALPEELGLEYVRIDGTIVKAHAKAAGAEGGPRTRPSAAPGAA